MSAREKMRAQYSHRFASEINRALADSNMSIRDLALKINESEGFLRRLLQGENHIGPRLPRHLFADISWATGQWMSASVSPIDEVETSRSVQSGAA